MATSASGVSLLLAQPLPPNGTRYRPYPHAVHHQSPPTLCLHVHRHRVPYAACGASVSPRELLLLLLLGSRPRRSGLRTRSPPTPTPRRGRSGSLALASGASASAAPRRCAPTPPSRRCRPRCRGPCRCASPTSCSRPDTATSTSGTVRTARHSTVTLPVSLHLSVLNLMLAES